jgi:ribosomal protein L29
MMLCALLAGSFSHAKAEESIDDQIAEIQKASPSDRVTLMNEFKKRLATMNEEDQLKAMAQMKERLQSKQPIASDAIKEAQRRLNQLNQTQQMNRMQQNMGQMQNMNMNRTMQGGKR